MNIAQGLVILAAVRAAKKKAMAARRRAERKAIVDAKHKAKAAERRVLMHVFVADEDMTYAEFVAKVGETLKTLE